MNNRIKSTDFDFEYTGSKFTEKDALEKGFKQLTGEALRERIINRTFYGDYPMGYKFITDIYENGKAEGINHVGSHDCGHWEIDMEKHTLSLKWENGWVDTVTRAYDVNGDIEFFDIETGNWRTTFKTASEPNPQLFSIIEPIFIHSIFIQNTFDRSRF